MTISETIRNMNNYLVKGKWVACPFYIERPDHVSIIQAVDEIYNCDNEGCDTCALIEHHWLQYCDCPKEEQA